MRVRHLSHPTDGRLRLQDNKDVEAGGVRHLALPLLWSDLRKRCEAVINLNLSREELAVIEHIGETLAMFGKLPLQREADMREFGVMCQRLQDFVAARPTYRRIAAEREVPKN